MSQVCSASPAPPSPPGTASLPAPPGAPPAIPAGTSTLRVNTGATAACSAYDVVTGWSDLENSSWAAARADLRPSAAEVQVGRVQWWARVTQGHTASHRVTHPRVAQRPEVQQAAQSVLDGSSGTSEESARWGLREQATAACWEPGCSHACHACHACHAPRLNMRAGLCCPDVPAGGRGRRAAAAGGGGRRAARACGGRLHRGGHPPGGVRERDRPRRRTRLLCPGHGRPGAPGKAARVGGAAATLNGNVGRWCCGPVSAPCVPSWMGALQEAVQRMCLDGPAVPDAERCCAVRQVARQHTAAAMAHWTLKRPRRSLRCQTALALSYLASLRVAFPHAACSVMRAFVGACDAAGAGGCCSTGSCLRASPRPHPRARQHARPHLQPAAGTGELVGASMLPAGWPSGRSPVEGHPAAHLATHFPPAWPAALCRRVRLAGSVPP